MEVRQAAISLLNPSGGYRSADVNAVIYMATCAGSHRGQSQVLVSFRSLWLLVQGEPYKFSRIRQRWGGAVCDGNSQAMRAAPRGLLLLKAPKGTTLVSTTVRKPGEYRIIRVVDLLGRNVNEDGTAPPSRFWTVRRCTCDRITRSLVG